LGIRLRRKERIDSLRGLSIDIQELIKSSEKGSYIIPYNELKSIHIKVPKLLGKGKIKILMITKKGQKHEFHVGPADLYKEYSKEEIYKEILNSLKLIPKLQTIIKTKE